MTMKRVLCWWYQRHEFVRIKNDAHQSLRWCQRCGLSQVIERPTPQYHTRFAGFDAEKYAAGRDRWLKQHPSGRPYRASVEP